VRPRPREPEMRARDQSADRSGPRIAGTVRYRADENNARQPDPADPTIDQLWARSRRPPAAHRRRDAAPRGEPLSQNKAHHVRLLEMRDRADESHSKYNVQSPTLGDASNDFLYTRSNFAPPEAWPPIGRPPPLPSCRHPTLSTPWTRAICVLAVAISPAPDSWPIVSRK